MDKKNESFEIDWKMEGFWEAAGEIPYTATNDFMFHMLMQENKEILRSFLSAVLRVEEDTISDIEVSNPINRGSSIDDKTLVLDIKVIVNHSLLINIEMQVVNYHNWRDRSVVYVCREFDQLFSGQKYEDVKPVTHIGVIDFDLDRVPGKRERKPGRLLRQIRLLDGETHEVYNDKLELRIVSLRELGNASDEDRKWKLDLWARAIKAKTWEELVMIAKKDEVLEKFGSMLYVLNSNDEVQELCRKREDFYRYQRTVNRDLAEQAKELEEYANYKKTVKREMEEKDKKLEEKDRLIAELMAKLQQR